ncbi:MAG: hypothetical protein KatS3mg062_0189 [Tepidiforma sp.]|nr:MAG: hypothetical protein KatS3mg062_0189 [Tepidiforma sp.]
MELVVVADYGRVTVVDLELGVEKTLVDRGGSWPAANGASLAIPLDRSATEGSAVVRVLARGDGATEIPATRLPAGFAIAPLLTHYVYCSADTVAVVQPSGTGGLQLATWSPGDPDATPLLVAAPLFLALDRESGRIAVHGGQGSGGSLLVFDRRESEPCFRIEGAGGFGAPAFLGQGDTVAWAEPIEGGRIRLRAARPGCNVSFSGPRLPGPVRFLSGTSGPEVLIAASEPGVDGFARILAWNPADDRVRQIAEGQLLAAWAHEAGGKLRLAVARPGYFDDGRLLMEFLDGEGRMLGRLEPVVLSAQERLAMAFFDQFGRSHDPWSRDGEWFALSGRLLGDGPHDLFGPPGLQHVLGVRVGEHGGPLRWVRLASGSFGRFL